MTSGLGALQAEGEESASGSGDWVVEWSGIIERTSTYLGHIATRGLVWVGLQSWYFAPAVAMAIGTFGLVDGVAAFGQDAGWNWSDPFVCRRFQAFLIAVAVVETALFVGGVFALGAVHRS